MLKFRKKQAKQLSLLFFGYTLLWFIVGYLVDDISITFGILMIIFFTLGAYIIGGYHNPNGGNSN